MKHRICARGIAAGSLALAAATPSAASPVAGFADTVSVVSSPAGLSPGFVPDGLASNLAEATATPAMPASSSQRPAAKTASGAKATGELHRRLDILVREYSSAIAADEERGCLAGAVYFEARGEPLEGQLAVAEVVLNRVASGEYPASICDVVKQPAQFSFVRDGLFPPIDERSVAWRTAVAVAHIADEKLADRLGADVLWYHADYVAPDWNRHLARATQIGAHVFYRRA